MSLAAFWYALRAAFAARLARVMTRLANAIQDWAERECIRASR